MAVSSTLVDEICDLGGFSFPRAPVLVYGYVKIPDRPLVREMRGDGRARFIAAGYVGEHKGTGIICEAAKLLLESQNDNFSIDVFGFGDVQKFVSLASSMGLSNHISFHGPVAQDHLHHEFERHDAFLFPTWEREPFAFAPFEAAAFGCVPILTSRCGCSERIVDGVHGIKLKRLEALANAMRSVMTGTTSP